MTPQTDIALAPFCTMDVGGPARWLIDARSESEIADALRWANQRGVEVHILGGGSNVVFSDEGIDGLVVRVNILGVEVGASRGLMVYDAGAGEPWDPLVERSVHDDAAGMECLSGIPGLVGGTPVQNVGAYGQDVSGTITRVDAIDRMTATRVSFSPAECRFGYRTSRFKHADAGRYIVTRVEFSLTAHGRPTVAYGDVVAFFEGTRTPAPALPAVRSAILEIRRRKGMVIETGNPANRSCGSFFVNPVVSRVELERVQSLAGAASVPHFAAAVEAVKIPAAWLIERAGFPKGTRRGAVGVSPFQAQAIVNLGGARAADVLELACDIKSAVWRMFAISMVPEPVFAGFARSPELRFLLAHLHVGEG